MSSLQKSNALQFLVEKRQETSPEIKTVLVHEWVWLYVQTNVTTTTGYAHFVRVLGAELLV